MFGMIVNDKDEITGFVGLPENDKHMDDRYKFQSGDLPAGFFSDFEPTKYVIDDRDTVIVNVNFDPESLPKGPIAEIDKPKADPNREALSSVVLQVAKLQASNQQLSKKVTDVDSKVANTENDLKNDLTKATVAQLTMQVANLQMANKQLTSKLSDVDSKVAEKTVDLDPTKKVIAQLTMQVANLQMTNQALNTKVAGLTKELTDLKKGNE